MDSQINPKTKPETSAEHLPSDAAVNGATSPVFPRNDFKPVLESRRTMLESLREVLSVKFYDRISGKLKEEESRALELSGLSRDKQKNRAKYSHVLDSQYFEQRFL
jgi:hypothetical protein